MMIWLWVSPDQGLEPVYICHSSTPNEYTSTARLTVPWSTSSGGMCDSCREGSGERTVLTVVKPN